MWRQEQTERSRSACKKHTHAVIDACASCLPCVPVCLLLSSLFPLSLVLFVWRWYRIRNFTNYKGPMLKGSAGGNWLEHKSQQAKGTLRGGAVAHGDLACLVLCAAVVSLCAPGNSRLIKAAPLRAGLCGIQLVSHQ